MGSTCGRGTAAAADGKAEHGRAHRADDVVEFVVALLLDGVGVICVLWTPAPRKPVAASASGSVGGDLVAGDLPA